MATTYTSGLRLTNQEEGGNANTWGILADDNFEFIDDAITDETSVNITGASSYTLTTNNGSDDEARKYGIYVYGIPSSANSVIIPASKKPYQIRTAHTSVSGGITIRTATGTGVSFNTGVIQDVYCDGLSVYAKGLLSALDPSDNLSDLPNVSAARDNLGLGPVALYQVSTLLSTVFNAVWPVGSFYSNRTDGTNPGTLMGFGTWASAGVGRVPIGVGTGVDANGVSTVVSAQACGGEYLHTMTTAELVTHSHGLFYYSGAGPDSFPRGTGDTRFELPHGTSVQGSSEPFNIQQPWYSVYQWIRTS